MFSELQNKYLSGDVPKIMIEKWLRSIEVPHTFKDLGDVREYYDSSEYSKFNNDEIGRFLRGVEFGGTKLVSVYSLPLSLVRDRKISILEKRCANIFNENGFTVEDIVSSEKELDIFVSEEFQSFKVKGGIYTKDTLIKKEGMFYYKPIQVNIKFVSKFTISLSKKVAYVCFDTASDLGKSYQKQFRKRKMRNLLFEVLGTNDLNPKNLEKSCKTLLGSDKCEFLKGLTKSSYVGNDHKFVDLNISVSANAPNEADFANSDDPNIKQLTSDDARHTSESVRVKWLLERSRGVLIRDINTTVYKDGMIDFTTHSMKEEVEYVLSEILRLSR